MRSDPPEQLARRNGMDAAMATIRVFAEDDVPAATALFARVYPEYRWHSQDACEAYFREMLFDNPWRDPTPGRGGGAPVLRSSRRTVRPPSPEPLSPGTPRFFRSRAGSGRDAVAFFRLHGRQCTAAGI